MLFFYFIVKWSHIHISERVRAKNAHLENTETAVQNRELDNERVNILYKNVATYGGLIF